jgi:alpha-N-arabinofuranosidase
MDKTGLEHNRSAFRIWLVLAMMIGGLGVHAQTTATLTVQANQPGVQISSNLFGIFFEEINSAGDGGIYAEMVSNRNFEAPG